MAQTSTAKEAVDRTYLRRYEWHCDEAQLAAAKVRAVDDEYALLRDAHNSAAMSLLWAADSERMNPIPPGLPR